MAAKTPMEIDCPFCPFTDYDNYYVMEHVECCHPEFGDSPFMVKNDDDKLFSAKEMDFDLVDASSAPSEEEYIECECGEVVMLSEFTSHTALHDMEEITVDSAAPTTLHPTSSPSYETDDSTLNSASNSSLSKDDHRVPRSTARHHSRAGHQKSHRTVQDFMNVLLGSSPPHSRTKGAKRRQGAPQRLGKSELGPYAHEDRMPEWLRNQLEVGAKVTITNHIDSEGRLYRVETVANEISGTIPVLGQLCEQDRALCKVYLCHPDVQHVVKMAKEGGFCGYRNIQMMISFIKNARSDGYHCFPGRIPSILQLQDLIENAWDRGINDSGRIETGGIKGTRKYIGTPEAQAILISHGIGCETNAFSESKDSIGYQQVLQEVENYFITGTTNPSQKVCRTSLPPLYFQHPGHSMTIIGLERRKNGSSSLLVLDPMFKPSQGIVRLIGTRFQTNHPEQLMKAYRRGDSYLSRYKKFELLRLTWRLPLKEGWDGL